MIKKTLVVSALGALMSANVAMAGPFVIDTGFDFDGAGGTTTTAANELGYTDTRATSIYLGDPSVAGTPVVDTNIESVMNSYGFAEGTFTAIDGTSDVDMSYPNDPAQKNIDALNFVDAAPDGNGFVSGVGGFPNDYGFAGVEGSTWGLTYDYMIEGTTTATGVSYNSGYFDVYFEDGTDRTQVVRLNVTGSDLAAANLDIFGNVTYDFDGDGIDDAAGDSFLENFFVDVESGETFYSLWKAGYDVGNLMNVSWILDTNVNPPLPTEDELVAFAGEDGTSLIRQANLDGSVVFQVPEPWTLGLFGAGLLALGFVARRRSRSVN